MWTCCHFVDLNLTYFNFQKAVRSNGRRIKGAVNSITKTFEFGLQTFQLKLTGFFSSSLSFFFMSLSSPASLCLNLPQCRSSSFCFAFLVLSLLALSPVLFLLSFCFFSPSSSYLSLTSVFGLASFFFDIVRMFRYIVL